MNILHFCDIFPLGLRLFLKVGSENKSGRKFEKDEELINIIETVVL